MRASLNFTSTSTRWILSWKKNTWHSTRVYALLQPATFHCLESILTAISITTHKTTCYTCWTRRRALRSGARQYLHALTSPLNCNLTLRTVFCRATSKASCCTYLRRGQSKLLSPSVCGHNSSAAQSALLNNLKQSHDPLVGFLKRSKKFVLQPFILC